MKKLFLLTVVVMFSMATTNAQGLKGGVNAGFITGDYSDWYSFNLSLDLNYLWAVSEGFDAGLATGYSHSFGKDNNGLKLDDLGFLPLAAAGRIDLSEGFTLGADIGYAVGISPSGNDGGFYYAPRIQFGVSEGIDIVAAYRGISNNGSTFNTITFGVEFGL